MPAQSPTLSPTLSAMVAGLRGSSSGIPASTLPTMSPPTSAPFVKLPPACRALAATRTVTGEVARRSRKRRADEESERDLPAQHDEGDDDDDRSGNGDGGVLAVEIGSRAFLDGGGDLLHFLRAGAAG